MAKPAVSRSKSTGVKPRGAAPVKRRGEGKQRILEAALELFSSLGYDAVSTADIARVANTSQSVVLYHFNTKEELWQSAMRHLFQTIDVRPRFDNTVYKDLDTTSRLRVLLRAFVQTSARHPELGRVISREGPARSDRLLWLIDELARANYAFFDQVFAEGIEKGVIKDYPPQMLTFMAHGAAATLFNLGALTGILMGQDPFDPAMADRQADMIVDTLLHGVLVRPD